MFVFFFMSCLTTPSWESVFGTSTLLVPSGGQRLFLGLDPSKVKSRLVAVPTHQDGGGSSSEMWRVVCAELRIDSHSAQICSEEANLTRMDARPVNTRLWHPTSGFQGFSLEIA